jgi:transcriptional regulator GlxA family with amidase domain
MQVAIALYPGFTAMDIIGPYEVLGRLPDTEVVFVAETPGLVGNDLTTLTVDVPLSFDDVRTPDVVLVGGGPGQVRQMSGRLVDWLREVDATATWMTSVCTGSLILAASGILDGRTATSHWGAYHQLADLGVTPSTDRVVIDGHYVTGAGISAGVDMALTLAGLMVGELEAQTVQLIMEYAPEPPYQAGSLATAPPEVVAHAVGKLAVRFPGLLDRSDRLSGRRGSNAPSRRAE